VTLVTGLIAAVAGLFPAIAMKLLEFVALYGLLLMPMGAVVFVDFWLSRKLGFQQYYAETKDLTFNWAAGLTWYITLCVCWRLVQNGTVQIFFVSLPGWFTAAGLYVVLSKLSQVEYLRWPHVLFSMEGRISLSEYWIKSWLVLFPLFLIVICSLVMGLEAVSHLAAVILLWSGFSLLLKRWHDRDHSGWWLLTLLIPILDIIILFWIIIEAAFRKGTHGPNRFGLDPLSSRKDAQHKQLAL